MEERPKADEEYLTEEQLRERISQPVPYCFGKEYSKLSAIARIAAAVSDGEALTEEAGRQLGREVQWLLVDRGLLFAQTRTRYYPFQYHWQNNVQMQACPSVREPEGGWEPYVDTLACDRDLVEYRQMVQDNAEWDQEKKWGKWMTAAPAIHEYLHPETLWGTGKVHAVPITEAGMDETERELTEIIRNYLEKLRSGDASDRSDDSAQGNERADKESEAEIVAERCAWNELSRLWSLPAGKRSKSADGQLEFYLIQHPGELFHLVRLPWLMKDFANTAKQERPVIRILRRCNQVRLPVTAQTWPLDRLLLEDIITVCGKGCRLAGLPFQQEAWEKLVDCLEFCVKSVSFSVDALYEIHGLWKKLLRYCFPGNVQKVYQPLDEILKNRYEGEGALCYLVPLWRLLENKTGNAETWRNMAQQYRKAFEDPMTEEETVREILYQAPSFGWNQISLNLHDKERAALKEQLPEALANRVIMQIDAQVRDYYAMKKAASDEEEGAKSKGNRHMELFLLEWALLQTICGQSAQELLGSAAALAKYMTAPEKQPAAKQSGRQGKKGG